MNKVSTPLEIRAYTYKFASSTNSSWGYDYNYSKIWPKLFLTGSTTTKKPKIIAVVGPNASGKSTLGIKLATWLKRHGKSAEIISAYSRQVYRGLDIGTGKITKREMRGVPHHLIDVASPQRIFSVAQFQRLGKTAIKKTLAKNKIPIIVGGTGLYVNALLGAYALPAVKPNFALRKKLERETTESLYKKLLALDPERAKTIDRFNPRRLVRALEIVLTTKKPVPPLGKSSPYEVLKIGVRLPERELKNRIHERLYKRVRAGMITEVQKLKKQGLSSKRLDALGLEYRFINYYLRGLMKKAEMLQALEKAIWQYAKRQMTWFKRDKEIHWISSPQAAIALAQKFLRMSSHGNNRTKIRIKSNRANS